MWWWLLSRWPQSSLRRQGPLFTWRYSERQILFQLQIVQLRRQNNGIALWVLWNPWRHARLLCLLVLYLSVLPELLLHLLLEVLHLLLELILHLFLLDLFEP